MVDAALMARLGRKGGQANKHRWTEEEREIVRRDYDGTNASAARIAQQLGVTFYGVKGQVQRLGVAKRSMRNGYRRPWDEEQDAQLADLINRYSVTTVARRLRRTPASVVVRAKRLGLSRRYRDGWYTKREVCEILGMDHKWVQARIDAGHLKASWHHGNKPQRNVLAAWHINEKDLRKFIRRYPHDLNGRNVDLVQIVEILAGLEIL